MCVVSNMIGPSSGGWWDKSWPFYPYATPQPWQLPQQLPYTESPNAIPWPEIQKDPTLATQLLKAIELLEKIDARVGALECKLEEKQKRKIKRELQKIAGGAK